MVHYEKRGGTQRGTCIRRKEKVSQSHGEFADRGKTKDGGGFAEDRLFHKAGGVEKAHDVEGGLI